MLHMRVRNELFFHRYDVLWKGELILGEIFSLCQYIVPVYSQLGASADRDGFLVGLCLRHGPRCYPDESHVVPVSRESQVME